MTIQVITHNGLTSIQEAANMLIVDLRAKGFIPVFPVSVDSSTYYATLEVPTSVDPLVVGDAQEGIPPQEWRITIDARYIGEGTTTEAGRAFMRIYMGTPNQLKDDGSITLDYVPDSETFNASTTPHRYSGELSAGYSITDHFTNATKRIPFFSYDGVDTTRSFSKVITDVEAHPISTQLILTDHGFSFFIWFEGQDSSGDKFSWFNVQRLVDIDTGAVHLSGNCPIFCLYSIGGGNPENTTVAPKDTFNTIGIPTRLPNIFKMVVRERDVNRPSVPLNACVYIADQAPVINAYQQVSIYENMTFALTMPNNFNTERFRYKEEMDLMMYTSADVISAHNTVDVTMFGKTRTYKAMLSNLPDNTGMRVLFLVDET